MQRTRQGFTLVELLVVIAIISVLAGMLLPVLEEAIDSARTISCANNMRQFYVSAAMFEADQNAIMPAKYYPRAPRGDMVTSYDPGDSTPAAYKVNGGTLADPVWVQSPSQHMLIDFGYVGEDARVSPTNMSNARTDTIFCCPNMYPGSPNAADDPYGLTPYSNAFFTGIAPDQIKRSLARGLYGYTENAAHFQDRAYYLLTGYLVTLNAGSGPYAGTNNGFPVYKRRAWSSGAPSQIGYIFESNGWEPGGDNKYKSFSNWCFRDQFTFDEGAIFGAPYGAPVRHNDYSTINMIYADGHLGSVNSETGYPKYADLPWIAE